MNTPEQKLEWNPPRYKIISERVVSIERLRELFELDRDAGLLRRRITISSKARAGDVVGSADGKGYLRIQIDGRKFRVHRINYAIDRGEWLFGEVDHRDENKTNNRPNNLREASHAENKRNVSKLKHNTSGISGIHWREDKKKWSAQITINGRQKYLGYFTDKAAAALAVDLARIEHHKQFARLNSPNAVYLAMAKLTRETLGVEDGPPIISIITP